MVVAAMGRRPHVLVIPYPAQGHVTPLMKLAYLISDHGIKVTFVSVESIHARLMADHKGQELSQIELVSIPDPFVSREDIVHVTESVLTVMPGLLKDLIEKMNRRNVDEKITYVVADATVGWAVEVAKKMGIEGSAFWPAGPVTLALDFHIPKLIEDGIIDSDGNPLKSELIRLSEDIPALSSTNLSWNCARNSKIRQICFEYAFRISQTAKNSNWVICNSFYELAPSLYDLIPNVLTLGPLHASNSPGTASGSLCANDPTCIAWLDKQTPGSVIYVAFGSTTFFKQEQFKELALGIELLGRPFLWVVPFSAEYPDGFMERVSEYGKIVAWANQEEVLAHPSVACFFSHCGWNSTMDSLSMGVPFLCWPHNVDQFDNQVSICDIWKVGLGLDKDQNELVSRQQIKTKIENLLADDGIKANAIRLKEMARRSVSEGGSSFNNFETFIEAL